MNVPTFIADSALAGDIPLPIDKAALRQQFVNDNPGAGFIEAQGRLERIIGPAFSIGPSAESSADSFRNSYSGLWGVPSQEVKPIGPFEDARHTVPIRFDPDTNSYKFTGVYYSQQRDGVPVFRGHLTLLVRNAANFPLVLASSTLKDLGTFRVQGQAAAAMHSALSDRAVRQVVGNDVQLSNPELVIWAGFDDIQVAQPALAFKTISSGVDRFGQFQSWLFLTDAVSGAILYQEDQVCTVDVNGTANGMATTGLTAWNCGPEASTGLPYVRMTIGTTTTFANANGSFTVPNPGTGMVSVNASLQGQYFVTRDVANNNATASLTVNVNPPGPANFLFNPLNTEFAAAEINAYRHANIVRDMVLAQNPSFPGIANQSGFPINVNIGQTCNAFYNASTINFYVAGSGCANTAFSTIVHHEFGHNVVEKGGSLQGEYGEGLGDCIAFLTVDNPCLGDGINGCGTCLRNANNACLYSPGGCSSCGSEFHLCGQVLSGSVWGVRNALVVSNPATYLNILRPLVIDSVLLHTGSMAITPSIAADFVTLDDDNGDISDGSPHYTEINAGFAAHNLAPPPLAPIKFTYPNGRPTFVVPAGGTTMRVVVSGLTGTPQPGTGMLHVDTGSGFVASSMNQVSSNVYDAVFPSAPCGILVKYFVSAQTTTAVSVNSPGTAPVSTFSATSATGPGGTVFSDNFELNNGWTVTNSPGLTAGTWDRGVPVAGCVRGNPPQDSDGSGQCYLTANNTGVQGNCDSDVDGGSTTLTSPSMNTTLGAPILSYSRWFNNHGDIGSTQDDVFRVQFSINGGTSWFDLETVGPLASSPVGDVDGGWVSRTFGLTGVPGFMPTNQFRVRFIAQDTGTGSVVEAGIDAVRLDMLNCSQFPFGDVNGDNWVDIDDLLAVINAWGQCPSGNCPADLDNNGVVNIDDLLIVINHWAPMP